jgi:hypothetical protein
MYSNLTIFLKNLVEFWLLNYSFLSKFFNFNFFWVLFGYTYIASTKKTACGKPSFELWTLSSLARLPNYCHNSSFPIYYTTPCQVQWCNFTTFSSVNCMWGKHFSQTNDLRLILM